MKKTDVILIVAMVLIGAAFLLWSNQAKADSIMCDGAIYTETTSIETTFPMNIVNVIQFEWTAQPRGWVRIYPWALKDKGSKTSIINNGRVSYPISRCIFVSDSIDSIENLKWFMRISRTN